MNETKQPTPITDGIFGRDPLLPESVVNAVRTLERECGEWQANYHDCMAAFDQQAEKLAALRAALVTFRVHTLAAAYALECNGRQETADSLRAADEQARAALARVKPTESSGDCDGTQDWNELADRERARGVTP